MSIGCQTLRGEEYGEQIGPVTKAPSASMLYSGVVSRRSSFEYDGQSFRDVVVAELLLEWEEWCGFHCGVGFTHRRSVVFDQRGTVVAVLGDQVPEIWIT